MPLEPQRITPDDVATTTHSIRSSSVPELRALSTTSV
jgi:hypothetical protein